MSTPGAKQPDTQNRAKFWLRLGAGYWERQWTRHMDTATKELHLPKQVTNGLSCQVDATTAHAKA